VLFICGGAFDGLDKIIQRRIGEKTIGFNTEIKKNKLESDDMLKLVQSEDLLQYGLIPEFIGRLPVMVTLHQLDANALVRIIKEPKNAILKQYKKLFMFDNVELEIEDDAVVRIAEKAIERKTGARGLRSILEHVMNDIMFELPSRTDIKKVIVTVGTIDHDTGPTLVLTTDKKEIAKSSKEHAS
jgi:ATP-dependent Clp protease ATP-binding subunit ClpX